MFQKIQVFTLINAKGYLGDDGGACEHYDEGITQEREAEENFTKRSASTLEIFSAFEFVLSFIDSIYLLVNTVWFSTSYAFSAGVLAALCLLSDCKSTLS